MTAEEQEPAATRGERSSVLPRLVNNFVHDMSTGTWAACLLVIAVVRARAGGVPAEAAVVLAEAMRLVFWLLVASLGGLAVTGGIRLRYWRAETPSAHVGTKRAALAFKHVAFLAVYGLGTAWAVLAVFD